MNKTKNIKAYVSCFGNLKVKKNASVKSRVATPKVT